MTPETKKLITPDLNRFILGQVPAQTLLPSVPMPGLPPPFFHKKDLEVPEKDPDRYLMETAKNLTVTAHIAYGKSNLPAYLEGWKKSWFDPNNPGTLSTRKNYLAWEIYLQVAFVLSHESQDPHEKNRYAKAFLEGVQGETQGLIQLGKEKKIFPMAEGLRRLQLLSGVFLKDRSSEEERKLILTQLRELFGALGEAIGPPNPASRPIQEYARARALECDLGLNPPDLDKPGELRKKIFDIHDHLTQAKGAITEKTPLTKEYEALINAELRFLPKVRSDASVTREFIARNTASFLMMIASEIDLTEGDSRERVEKRYNALTESLVEEWKALPEDSFAVALKEINTPESQHLLKLIEENQVLRELIDAEKASFLLQGISAKAESIVSRWQGQVMGVLKGRTQFLNKVFEHGELHLASYQEILRQFVRKSGVAPSPMAQSFKNFAGVLPEREQEISNEALKLLREMDSTPFKIGNGLADFFSLKTLLFVGATSLLNRTLVSLLITRAGGTGAFAFRGLPFLRNTHFLKSVPFLGETSLVAEGELTKTGHFFVGTSSGVFLSFGFSALQLAKDLQAGRTEAGKNFGINLAVGSLINLGVLGLSALGAAAVRKGFSHPSWIRSLQSGNTKGFSLAWKRALPYGTHIAIGTGSMLGANALTRGVFHNWRGSTKENEKVPYITLDETVETILTMLSLNLAEVGINHASARRGGRRGGDSLLKFQLGEFRNKKIDALAQTLAEERYGVGDLKHKQLIFNRLALEALRGVPLKDLKSSAFKTYLAGKLNLPPPLLDPGTIVEQPKKPPPPPPRKGATPPAAPEAESLEKTPVGPVVEPVDPYEPTVGVSREEATREIPSKVQGEVALLLDRKTALGEQINPILAKQDQGSIRVYVEADGKLSAFSRRNILSLVGKKLAATVNFKANGEFQIEDASGKQGKNKIVCEALREIFSVRRQTIEGEAQSLKVQLEEVKTTAAQVQAELREAKGRVGAIMAELETKENQLATVEKAKSELGQNHTNEILGLTQQIETLRSELKVEKQKAAQLETQMQQATWRANDAEEKNHNLTEDLKQQAKDFEELEGNLTQARRDLARASEELGRVATRPAEDAEKRRLEVRVQELEREVVTLNQKLDEEEGKRTELRKLIRTQREIREIEIARERAEAGAEARLAASHVQRQVDSLKEALQKIRGDTWIVFQVERFLNFVRENTPREPFAPAQSPPSPYDVNVKIEGGRLPFVLDMKTDHWSCILGRERDPSKAPPNLFNIQDPVVSRHHAQIIRTQDGKTQLFDRVGDKYIPAYGTWVKEGDQWIKLGDGSHDLQPGQFFALGSLEKFESQNHKPGTPIPHETRDWRGNIEEKADLSGALVFQLSQDGMGLVYGEEVHRPAKLGGTREAEAPFQAPSLPAGLKPQAIAPTLPPFQEQAIQIAKGVCCILRITGQHRILENPSNNPHDSEIVIRPLKGNAITLTPGLSFPLRDGIYEIRTEKGWQKIDKLFPETPTTAPIQQRPAAAMPAIPRLVDPQGRVMELRKLDQLGGLIVLGRSPEVDVVIPFPQVSNRHALIICKQEGSQHVYLLYRGTLEGEGERFRASLNPTLINGRPLKPGESVKLNPQDRITLSDVTFTWQAAPREIVVDHQRTISHTDYPLPHRLQNKHFHAASYIEGAPLDGLKIPGRKAILLEGTDKFQETTEGREEIVFDRRQDVILRNFLEEVEEGVQRVVTQRYGSVRSLDPEGDQFNLEALRLALSTYLKILRTRFRGYPDSQGANTALDSFVQSKMAARHDGGRDLFVGEFLTQGFPFCRHLALVTQAFLVDLGIRNVRMQRGKALGGAHVWNELILPVEGKKQRFIIEPTWEFWGTRANPDPLYDPEMAKVYYPETKAGPVAR